MKPDQTLAGENGERLLQTDELEEGAESVPINAFDELKAHNDLLLDPFYLVRIIDIRADMLKKNIGLYWTNEQLNSQPGLNDTTVEIDRYVANVPIPSTYSY